MLFLLLTACCICDFYWPKWGVKGKNSDSTQQELWPSVCSLYTAYMGLQHVLRSDSRSHLFALRYKGTLSGEVYHNRQRFGEVTVAEKWVKLTLKCFAVVDWTFFLPAGNVEINWNAATPQTRSSEREISLWWKWMSGDLCQDYNGADGFLKTRCRYLVERKKKVLCK